VQIKLYKISQRQFIVQKTDRLNPFVSSILGSKTVQLSAKVTISHAKNARDIPVPHDYFCKLSVHGLYVILNFLVLPGI
jgi:hypothetical protein